MQHRHEPFVFREALLPLQDMPAVLRLVLSRSQLKHGECRVALCPPTCGKESHKCPFAGVMLSAGWHRRHRLRSAQTGLAPRTSLSSISPYTLATVHFPLWPCPLPLPAQCPSTFDSVKMAQKAWASLFLSGFTSSVLSHNKSKY